MTRSDADEPVRPTRSSHRLRRRFRDAVLGSGPPTQAIGERRQISGLTGQEEVAVLDLALRTGEVLLASGAPVADATLAMQRLAWGLKLHRPHVDITFTSITASVDREDGSLTRVRIVDTRSADYTRVAALHALVDEISAGDLDIEEAGERLDRIVRAPHPYRRWVVTSALAGMAAAIAVMLGGGWQVALLAAATTAVIDRALRRLRRRGLPYLFQQALGAAFVTAVALLLLWGQNTTLIDLSVLPPSLVVASGIVVLLAGLSLVGASQDAISGFPLTAAARSFEVALYTIGIVAGIGAMLGLGARLGVPLAISDPSMFSAPAPLRIVAGGAVAGCWALSCYASVRTCGIAAGIGAVAVGVSVGADSLGLGPTGSVFCAALVVGAISGLVARRAAAPSVVLTTCGITPLLPGLAIYGAIFELVQGSNILSGTTQLIGALAIGLALAAGVSLGDFVSSLWRGRTDRWQRALQRRARSSRT